MFDVPFITPTVTEERGKILITNIPARLLTARITKKWQTSRIVKHMFTTLTYRRLEFYSFFAVEVLHLFDSLKGDLGLPNGKNKIIEVIKDELVKNTWLKSTQQTHRSRTDGSRLSIFKKQPLDMQHEFINTYDKNTAAYGLEGFMLASPPGTGKTLAGLMLGAAMGCNKFVIICPNNAVHRVWEKTVKDDIKGEYKIWMSDSGTPPPEGMDVYICHYEYLTKFKDQLPKSLYNGNDVMLDLDECHNMNEIKSARSGHYVELTRALKPKVHIWASGTPLKAVGGEMVPFLRAVDPLFTDAVERRFLKIFGVSRGAASELLARRIGISSFKVDKRTIVEDNLTEVDIPVSFKGAEKFTLSSISGEMQRFIKDRVQYYAAKEEEHRELFDYCIKEYRKHTGTAKQYDELEWYLASVKTLASTRDLRPYNQLMVEVNKYELGALAPALPKELRKDFKDVRSVIKYTHLKIRGEALGRVLSRRRIECAIEIVKHVDVKTICADSPSKTIFFSSYVDVVEEAMNVCRLNGLRPIKVHGETNKDLSKIISAFEKDKRVNPLIATLDSLSTAVPLIMASTEVFLNQPFRHYEKEQAVSRVDRLGQRFNVLIINILLDTGEEKNISTRSMDILKWSQEQVDILMGYKTTTDEMSLEGYCSDELDDLSFDEISLLSENLEQNNKDDECLLETWF